MMNRLLLLLSTRYKRRLAVTFALLWIMMHYKSCWWVRVQDGRDDSQCFVYSSKVIDNGDIISSVLIESETVSLSTSQPTGMPTLSISLSTHSKRTTSLIIAGTQKGGTTALYNYIYRHPQVQRNGGNRIQEMHYFDMKERPRSFPNGTVHPKDVPGIREDYLHYWNVIDPNVRVTVEKTPIYMFIPEVVGEIKSVVPDAKIIILLRDPVERAFSHFKMMEQKKVILRKFGPNGTFEDCIKDDIKVLNANGILVEATGRDMDKMMTPNDRMTADELDRAWSSYVRYPRQHRCDSVIGRGLYILQLRVWWKHYNQEERDNQFLIMKSEQLRPDASSGMIDMNPITDFLNITEMSVNGTNVIFQAQAHADMSTETREMLGSLFDPFNAELKTLLGVEWENPW